MQLKQLLTLIGLMVYFTFLIAIKLRQECYSQQLEQMYQLSFAQEAQ
ncbi:Uncharacterised protein [Mycobacteroides abscessus subsp. massiliense]|nr:Uncharacterised protein [Mycobacteroides abscessus subsp. massiliense]